MKFEFLHCSQFRKPAILGKKIHRIVKQAEILDFAELVKYIRGTFDLVLSKDIFRSFGALPTGVTLLQPKFYGCSTRQSTAMSRLGILKFNIVDSGGQWEKEKLQIFWKWLTIG